MLLLLAAWRSWRSALRVASALEPKVGLVWVVEGTLRLWRSVQARRRPLLPILRLSPASLLAALWPLPSALHGVPRRPTIVPPKDGGPFRARVR
jgi:hypothetical protein